jgi:large subunit ribosomal protein L22
MATTAETLRRTNEQPGTRAKLKNLPSSAFKVRQVLDLIRGEDVHRALEILEFCERAPAEPVAKLLNSAIANAVNNDDQDRDELFVSACFADEGTTMKRWRPRARGRAGRIRKRSSHITIIVSRLPEDRLERLRGARDQQEGSRRRRVASSRASKAAAPAEDVTETAAPGEAESTETAENVKEEN